MTNQRQLRAGSMAFATLMAIVLLATTGCGPADPPDASGLIGIWHLQRSSGDRSHSGHDLMKFMEDGRLIWAAGKGVTTTDRKQFRYRVEGDTIVIDPPPSPESARVRFRLRGGNTLVTLVGDRELVYKRVADE